MLHGGSTCAALWAAATYAQEPYERARGQVNFVAPFNSAAFPDALAIAKEGVLPGHSLGMLAARFCCMLRPHCGCAR